MIDKGFILDRLPFSFSIWVAVQEKIEIVRVFITGSVLFFLYKYEYLTCQNAFKVCPGSGPVKYTVRVEIYR